MEDWLARQSIRPLPWMGLFALLLAIQISPWWYPTPDAAAYLSIARAIATTHRFRNLGGVHLAYPPGYPLLISPAFLISGRPFVILSAMHWLMALILMAGVYRWTVKLAPEAALLLTGLTMVNVTLWIYFRRTLSELAFMTVMIWTAIMLDAVLDAGSRRSGALKAALGGLLLIALAMIREPGVLLGLGFAIAALLRVHDRELRAADSLWMSAMVAAPAAAGVLAFLLYDRATARAAPSAVFGTHLSGFLDPGAPILPRIVEGLRLQISEAGRLIVPGMFKSYAAHEQWLNINVVIYLAMFALVAAGWWRLIHRRREVLAATLPLYFALYVAWAFDADARYLLPFLPVLLASLWFVLEPLTRSRLTVLAALLVLHLAVALGYWTTVEIPRGRECNRQWTAVETFVPDLRDATGLIVATHQVPECARLMLSFLIDRPLPERQRPGDFPQARWLLLPSDTASPSGFGMEKEEQHYKLLVRK